MEINPNTQELEKINERLLELEQEKADLLAQKNRLIVKAFSTETINNSFNQNIDKYKLSTNQKVDLFAQLFKGRKDIYATRWENKLGRSGYSVACANEWQPIICTKPKVKCSDCRNRSFKPLDNTAIFDHLSGKKTIGLYPLLSNNECCLLAVDFDKSDWQADVTAFSEACLSWNIPFALERSRSGNGAHIWIFFDKPVLAKDARNFGFALLDKAMEKHVGLSFDSYDRLFPNQDILPDGGFGNLIALPLQLAPRQSGNSVFIDLNFNAWPDQWAFLASLNRLNVNQMHECLEIVDRGKVIEEEELKPWEKCFPIVKDKISGCPKSLTIVLANKIYIATDVLPQALLARLKRTASFSNPEFFKTQALRFSTHGIPRFICLAHLEQNYLLLPRGCLDDVVAILEDQLIDIEFDDKRKTGQKIKKIHFKGELRNDQKKAVTKLNLFDIGILHAPTAFGKTVAAIGLIYKRKVNTLILVHSRQLLDQWKEWLNMFLDGVDIGVIGGGKRKPKGQKDVATYQSLINCKDNSVDSRLFDYGQVIIDECHHLSAPNYDRLLNEVHAKYVLGITATPQRQDGHQPIIFMQAGPIRHTVKLDAREQFEQQVVVTKLETIPLAELLNSETRPHFADVYRWLIEYSDRNKQIINDVVREVENNRNPIILTERRVHAVMLGELLALPISWKGSLAQYVGRIHRQFTVKERVTVYDYVDQTLPMLRRMFQKRIKGYEAMGYSMSFKDNTLIQTKLFKDR